MGRRNAGLRRLHVAGRGISLSLLSQTLACSIFWRQKKNGLLRHTVDHHTVTLEGMDLGLGVFFFPWVFLLSAFLASKQTHFCRAVVAPLLCSSHQIKSCLTLAGVSSKEHPRLPNQCPCLMAVYFSLTAYRSVPSDCSSAGRLCDETTPVWSGQLGFRPQIKRPELLSPLLRRCDR